MGQVLTCCVDGGRDDGTRRPLLAERTSSAFKAGSSSSGGPSPTKPKKKWQPSASGDRCAACRLPVFITEKLGDVAGGLTFHKACFKCSHCGRGLRPQGGWDMAVGPGLAGKASLLCDKCLTGRKRRGSLKKSTTAGERHVVTHTGDVAGVKQTLGDKLEAICGGLAPKCAICGGQFVGAQEMEMRGHLKYHTDCLRAGKPLHKCEVTPKQASRALPDRLTVRAATSASKAYTFFMVLVDDDRGKGGPPSSSFQSIEAVYEPDKEARASNPRKVQLPGDGSAATMPLTVTIQNDPALKDDAGTHFSEFATA
eukprot:g153.t1